MTDQTDESNVVETLRLKTEEIDMDQYLKTKWGGYTKQSVLEYLNVLRKQQQTTADTFYRNLQIVYNEKETINKANETLKNQLKKIESEYKNLCESMESVQLEDSNLTMQDIIALKNKSAVLEEERKKVIFDKTSLENEIKHLKNTINDLTEKLNQSERETAAAKEVIIAEKQESKGLRDQVVKLTIEIEDKTDELKYLMAMQTESQISELTSHVSQLTAQLTNQTEAMANLNSEVNLKEKTVETLTAEIGLQKQMLNDLSKTVEDLQNQNEKLLHANTAFTKQLQESYAKTIELINEKSDITIEKIAANRKLDMAGSKIAMLEMKLEKSDTIKDRKELDELKGC